MWNNLKVARESRLEYTIRNLAFLTEAGPLVGMGLALASQWRKKSESGNAFDLYHLSYLPFVGLFFTSDAALLDTAYELSDSIFFRRVRSFNELLRSGTGA